MEFERTSIMLYIIGAALTGWGVGDLIWRHPTWITPYLIIGGVVVIVLDRIIHVVGEHSWSNFE